MHEPKHCACADHWRELERKARVDEQVGGQRLKGGEAGMVV